MRKTIYINAPLVPYSDFTEIFRFRSIDPTFGHISKTPYVSSIFHFALELAITLKTYFLVENDAFHDRGEFIMKIYSIHCLYTRRVQIYYKYNMNYEYTGGFKNLLLISEIPAKVHFPRFGRAKSKTWWVFRKTIR